MDTKPEILTLDQAAEMLQISKRTMQRLLKVGAIPGRQVGGQWRFDREQLRDWIRAGHATDETERDQRALLETEATRLGVDRAETLVELQRYYLQRHGKRVRGDNGGD